MFLSATIETVIGLMLIYLVLSLFCTSLNEAIAGLLRLRGRVLFAELRRVIDDEEVGRSFWRSGLVHALSGNRPGRDVTGATAPSHIDTRIFVLALMQALRRTGTKGDAPGPTQRPDATPGEIVAMSGAQPGSVLHDALLALAERSGQSTEAFEDELAQWFDQAMGRASGLYRRHMRLMSFVVAGVIVAAFGADTLAIIEVLWRDDTVRANFTDIAAALVAQETPPSPETLDTLLPEILPMTLGLPESICEGGCLAERFLGSLMTALAMTLGAPFWFDLLSRVVRMRDTARQAGG